jgi:hypothetical protein
MALTSATMAPKRTAPVHGEVSACPPALIHMDPELSEAIAARMLGEDDALAYPELRQAAAQGRLQDAANESDLRRFLSIRRTLLEMATAKSTAKRTAEYAAAEAREREAGLSSRPLDALDARTKLVETLSSTDGRGLAIGATKGVRPTFTRQVDDEFINATSNDLDRLTTLIRNEATTFWIAPDMVDLVVSAAHSMPAQPLLASDLPTQRGFAWFPYSADVAPFRANLRGAVWQADYPSEGTMRVTWLVSRDVWHLQGKDRAMRWPLFPCGWDDWPLGHSYRRTYDHSIGADDSSDDAVKPAIETIRRLLQAMWSIMAEPYVAAEEVRVDRNATRRAQRAGLTTDGQVRVVTLRRANDRRSTGDPSNVQWSRRWVVSAHWRNQWYPSRGVHRQRFIAPYVKGPDNKPLLISQKVFALRR